MPQCLFTTVTGVLSRKRGKKIYFGEPISRYDNLILFDSVFCYIKQNPSLKNSGTGVVRS
jgi:hypothetical protein